MQKYMSAYLHLSILSMLSWTVEKKKDSVSLNVHDILIIVIILRLLMTDLSFNGNDNHRWNQGINHDVIKCKAYSFLTRS